MSCECAAHALAASRGFLTAEDVDLIHELVLRLPSDRKVSVADLGAGSGTTALAVLCARPERVSVVTADRDPIALYWAGQAVRNIGRGADWTGVQSDAADLGRAGGLLVDLVLLDASHEYDATAAEIDAWLPRLRREGYFWAHDYAGDYPGVARAIDEAVAGGKLRLLKAAGLGWAGVLP